MNRYNVELEDYSMYSVYFTSKSGVAGIVVIDFNDFGLLFLFQLNWNRCPEFRILIPVIPLPEKSQKNNAV